MRYDFKVLEELGWAAVVAGGVFALQLLAAFDVEEVAGDWQAYFVAGLSGIVRAAAGAILGRVRS